MKKVERKYAEYRFGIKRWDKFYPKIKINLICAETLKKDNEFNNNILI